MSYNGRFLVLSYGGRFMVFELQWTLFGSNQKASSTQHSLRQNRLLPLYYSGRSGRFWTLWTLFGDAAYEGLNLNHLRLLEGRGS